MRAQEPCGPGLLRRLFAGWGRTSRVPTLWIYAENDQWMGPKYPREWFEAFREAGGAGEFVPLPPFGDDGHAVFVRGPEVWRPRVEEFLRGLGLVGGAVQLSPRTQAQDGAK